MQENIIVNSTSISSILFAFIYTIRIRNIMLLSGCFLLTYLPLMQKCDKRGGGGGGLVGIRGSSLEDDEDVFEEPGHHHRRSR